MHISRPWTHLSTSCNVSLWEIFSLEESVDEELLELSESSLSESELLLSLLLDEAELLESSSAVAFLLSVSVSLSLGLVLAASDAVSSKKDYYW